MEKIIGDGVMAFLPDLWRFSDAELIAELKRRMERKSINKEHGNGQAHDTRPKVAAKQQLRSAWKGKGSWW